MIKHKHIDILIKETTEYIEKAQAKIEQRTREMMKTKMGLEIATARLIALEKCRCNPKKDVKDYLT